MRDTVVARIREIAQRVGASEGIEIVDVVLAGSGNGRLLRITIDKPAGVSHADCELISQQVGTILDIEDVVPGGRYTLEVSSPGVERKLSSPEDFERFKGKKAKIVLREPVEGRKLWEGKLLGLADGVITIEPEQGKAVQVGFQQVQRANLKFEW